MRLNKNSLKNYSWWEKADIELPKFNVDKMVDKTKINPSWVHFGAGNIFKGFISVIPDTLLNKQIIDTGIIAVETYDIEIVEKVYIKSIIVSFFQFKKCNSIYISAVY